MRFFLNYDEAASTGISGVIYIVSLQGSYLQDPCSHTFFVKQLHGVDKRITNSNKNKKE